MKYILTRNETIRRTEVVEYFVNIPKDVKNKEKYANDQIIENKYEEYRIVDIIDGEILDEEIVGLKATNPSIKRDL